MGSAWAPDMMGGSPLFWVMAAMILGEGIIIVRLLAHGVRGRRTTTPAGPATRERPEALPAAGMRAPGLPGRQPGRMTGAGKLLALAGVAAGAAWIGLDMRHGTAPAPPATAARPPAPVIIKEPAPAVVHTFHWPLSGAETLIAVIVIAVLIAGVRGIRARSR